MEIGRVGEEHFRIMMSVMEWIQRFRAQAARDDDKERLRLANFYFQARNVGGEQHEMKLEIFRAGGDLARQLGEPWWAMFYEFWKISTLLCLQQQVSTALDLATRAVLEVAKPLYDGCPVRPNLNLLLVSVYTEIDPIWHQARIRATFEYLRECESWIGFPAFLAQQWAHFLDVTDDEAAIAAAWQSLRLADEIDSDHYRAGAFLLLCKLLWQREPQTARQTVGDLSAQAQACASNRKDNLLLAAALMWRAVSARCDGDETAARRLYTRAFAIQNRLKIPEDCFYPGAIAYYRSRDEWNEALRVAQAELRFVRAHKLTFQEARLRLQKIELLRRAGRSCAREEQRLCAVATRLPSRAHWEAKLDAL